MRDLRRVLKPLANRIANLVSRAIVRRVDDSTKWQTVQVDVLNEETRDGVERPQNYGFTSVPLAGAEAVVLFVGGSRAHGLAVAVDDRRHRLKGLQPGEVAVYTDQGDSVVIRRGGTIEVTAATKVTLNAPVVELAGAMNPVAKGDTLNTAIAQLGTAIANAVNGMGSAGPVAPITGTAAAAARIAINAAVTAFSTAAQNALSTKVKLG